MIFQAKGIGNGSHKSIIGFENFAGNIPLKMGLGSFELNIFFFFAKSGSFLLILLNMETGTGKGRSGGG